MTTTASHPVQEFESSRTNSDAVIAIFPSKYHTPLCNEAYRELVGQDLPNPKKTRMPACLIVTARGIVSLTANDLLHLRQIIENNIGKINQEAEEEEKRAEARMERGDQRQYQSLISQAYQFENKK